MSVCVCVCMCGSMCLCVYVCAFVFLCACVYSCDLCCCTYFPPVFCLSIELLKYHVKNRQLNLIQFNSIQLLLYHPATTLQFPISYHVFGELPVYWRPTGLQSTREDEIPLRKRKLQMGTVKYSCRIFCEIYTIPKSVWLTDATHVNDAMTIIFGRHVCPPWNMPHCLRLPFAYSLSQQNANLLPGDQLPAHFATL